MFPNSLVRIQGCRFVPSQNMFGNKQTSHPPQNGGTKHAGSKSWCFSRVWWLDETLGLASCFWSPKLPWFEAWLLRENKSKIIQLTDPKLIHWRHCQSFFPLLWFDCFFLVVTDQLMVNWWFGEFSALDSYCWWFRHPANHLECIKPCK